MGEAILALAAGQPTGLGAREPASYASYRSYNLDLGLTTDLAICRGCQSPATLELEVNVRRVGNR
jgi:hypothetical protein